MNDLLQQAATAYKEGNYKKAIEFLSQLEEGTEDDNWFASMYLGMAYVKSDKAADTSSILQVISSSSPESIRKTAAALLAWYKSTEEQTLQSPRSRADGKQEAG